MQTRVALIHAYSALNKGDGLLVEEALDLTREALSENALVDLFASYPESFQDFPVGRYRTRPSWRGYSWVYLKVLLTRFHAYDGIIAVGGGYLRFGTPMEAIKSALVMGPQLLAASLSKTPTVYLPQSVGPARRPRALKWLTSRIDRLWVRDDRSLQLLNLPNVRRAPDLALLGLRRRSLDYDTASTPVLNVRVHRGSVPSGVRALASALGGFDGYVQSTVSGNDDTEAVASIAPARVLSRQQLLDAPVGARVVVAMRLHAALMAMAAGHYVVHLAYERKGFGAFEDLGLEEYVFNVHRFDTKKVSQIIARLQASASAREAYDTSCREAIRRFGLARADVVGDLQRIFEAGNVAS